MAAGAYDGSIRIDTSINSNGFNQGIRGLNNGINSITGGLKKMAGAVGLAFGVAALVKFGKEAINIASDMQEVQNVVDTAFGDMAYKCEEFASTAIEQFGMSELAAKKTASTYMAMSKGMGLDSAAASDMAISVAQLTGDVSSFYNISQELASVKLKAIWTGETEGLKDLGIVMTQTNLQQFALQKGISKNIAKMTQAEQTTLRYHYVMEQLSLAQGDFAKTSNSWANQTRVLTERFKQLLGILGSGLMQALLPAVKLLNTLMSMLISFANTLSAVLSQMFGKVDEEASKATASVEEQSKSAEDLATNTEAAGNAAGKSSASFDELNVLASPAASGGNAGTTDVAIGTLPQLADAGSGATKQTSAAVEHMVQKISKAVGFIKGIIDTVKQDLLPTLSSILEGVGGIFSTAFVTLQGIFTTLWTGWLSPWSKTIIQIFADIWQVICDFWALYGDPIFTGIQDAIKTTGELFGTVWANFLKPILDNIAKTVDWLWTKHLKPLVDEIAVFVGELIICALDIYNKFIAPIVNWLVSIFGPVFANVFNTVVDIIGTAIAFISDIVKSIITILKGIIQFVTGVFTGDWGKAWEGICNIFKGIWDAVVAAIKFPINLIIDAINFLCGHVVAMMNSLINAINNIAFDIPDWVLGLGGKKFGFNFKPIVYTDIPKLATGAVIPPNSEFLAIMGDQKSGRNIEAPEGLIRRIIAEELAAKGNNGTTVVLKFSGSLAQVGRVLKPVLDAESKRQGIKLVTEGV